MKMSKAKRQAAAEAAAQRPYIVAYTTCGRDAHGTPIVKPVTHRYGPDQFRFHLENVMVMAETSGNPVRVVTLGRFMRGELRFYMLAGVVYENRNYRVASNLLQLGTQMMIEALRRQALDKFEGAHK